MVPTRGIILIRLIPLFMNHLGDGLSVLKVLTKNAAIGEEKDKRALIYSPGASIFNIINLM